MPFQYRWLQDVAECNKHLYRCIRIKFCLVSVCTGIIDDAPPIQHTVCHLTHALTRVCFRGHRADRYQMFLCICCTGFICISLYNQTTAFYKYNYMSIKDTRLFMSVFYHRLCVIFTKISYEISHYRLLDVDID